MAHLVSYNGVMISSETPLGKELMKFERPANYRPENHPYPRMLYKAVKQKDGTISAHEVEPSQYGWTDMGQYQREIERIRTFNESCQKTVKNEEEHLLAKGAGWRESIAEAVQARKDEELEKQVAAAEFAYETRNFSEKAKAEIREAEKSTDEVLADMPPAKRRGRPRKDDSSRAA